MGAGQFDRQAFLHPEGGPPGRNPLALIGPLLLAAVVIVGGLAVYKFVIADSPGEVAPSNSTELTQVQHKLDAMEKRLDQLERRRKMEAPVNEVKEQSTAAKDQPAALPVPTKVIYRMLPAPGSRQPSSATVQPGRDPQNASQKRAISTLQGDVSASREEWEAAANRLGTVVGELGAQRTDIDTSKQTLNQLLDRFQRQDYSFTLQRREGRMRVGPLALALQNADSKSGRYTMRILVNDKWIEFKDRALHEAVEFYPSGSTIPIELVVSRMTRDQVVGRLAVPQDLGNH